MFLRPNARRSYKSLTRRLPLLAIAIAYFALSIAYSLATPLNEGPDEIWHYLYVRHIAEGKGLPIQDPRGYGVMMSQHEASQAPLYYLVSGLLTSWIPTTDPVSAFVENPQAAIGDASTLDNKNRFIHPSSEDYLFADNPLAQRVARLVSAMFGSLTVWVTGLIALRLRPTNLAFASLAAGLVAFNPQFIFTGATVTNDSSVAFAGSLLLFCIVALWKYPTSRRWALALGISVGVAFLTKFSSSVAIPLVGLVLTAIAWRRRDWRLFLTHSAIVVTAAIAISGWWWIRSLIVYGDLAPSALLRLGAIGQSATAAEIISDLEGLLFSYWGVFGWFNLQAPDYVHRLFNLYMALAAVGLVVGAIRRGIRRPTGPWLAIAGWSALFLGGLMRYRISYLIFQGRLLFGAISSNSLLLAAGLYGLLPERRAGLAVAGLLALPLAASISVVPSTLLPAFAKPVLLDNTESFAAQHAVDQSIGGFAGLRSYSVSSNKVRPGDTIEVDLLWEALDETDQNYLVFVKLVGKDYEVASRDTFPSGGNYATSLWRKEDIFVDRHWISIPDQLEAPNILLLVAGLYDLTAMKPLLVDHGAGADFVRLPDIEILHCEVGHLDAGQPTEVVAGDLFRIDRYQIERIREPAQVIVRLEVSVLRKPELDYTFFVHLTGNGKIISQDDHQPFGDSCPTSVWRNGERYVVEFTIPHPTNTPSGEYELIGGVYYLATMERLRTNSSDSFSLGEIRIE